MTLAARVIVWAATAYIAGASRHANVRQTHASPCSDEATAAIVTARPIANSNCPDTSRWVQLVIDQESQTTGRATSAFDVINIVSVGCNKGDDLVRQMQMWTHSTAKYDVASFRNATQAYGMQAGRACPSEPYVSFTDDSNLRKHTIPP